jgi:hypothetical protein
MGIRVMILALGAAAMFAVGCTKSAPQHEHFVSPVQQDLGGMKGYDMPRTDGNPMPAGWKGFKPY